MCGDLAALQVLKGNGCGSGEPAVLGGDADAGVHFGCLETSRSCCRTTTVHVHVHDC